MRPVVPCVLTVTCLLGSARAENGSLDDLLGPREIALGEAMRGGATGATAIGLNPAGLPLNRELVFEGGYGYRASDSASLIGVSVCDSTPGLPGCFFYDYAGASPELDGMTGTRRTHVGGVALSRLVLPRIMIGATAKYFNFESDMMTDRSASGFAFDVGTTVRLSEMINLGVAGQNLWTTEDTTQFPRAVGGGLLARPSTSIALSFDMRWRFGEEERPLRYGGGAEVFLRGKNGQMGFPVRAGGLHDSGLGTTYVSGGLGLATLKWGVDIAARRAVDGGDDTMVLASMRFFTHRMAAPALDGPGSGFE